MEEIGLGLNASGSYVLSSLDTEELNHLKTVVFHTVAWRTDESVIIVRGKPARGSLVRIVNLSIDGRYCRFPGKFRFLSPRLLESDPMSVKDFILSISSNPTLHIKKFKDRCEYFGVLVGPRDAGYKSLITLKGNRLLAVDIEEETPPQFPKEKTIVISDNPHEGNAMRQELIARFGF